MSHVLALDPGINYPAAALFVNGELLAASRVKLKTAWKKLPRSERILTVAREIRAWYASKMSTQITKLEFVWEFPQVYARSKSKGDPNDLLPLVGVGSCLAGLMYDNVHEFIVADYLPKEWARLSAQKYQAEIP